MGRGHRIWQCGRCHATFKSKNEEVDHTRADVMCEKVESQAEVVGINSDFVEFLKLKGRAYERETGINYHKQSEEERWVTIYKKLFSTQTTPSSCK